MGEGALLDVGDAIGGKMVARIPKATPSKEGRKKKVTQNLSSVTQSGGGDGGRILRLS